MKKLILAAGSVVLLAACHNTRKVADNNKSSDPIVNKHWQLIQLEGKPMAQSNDKDRQTWFMLNTDGSVSGNTGCNGLGGTYKLEAGQRIRFSEMLGTLMYCDDVPWEADYKKVFELADNYTMQRDTLWLNVGRRAPLAGFVSMSR